MLNILWIVLGGGIAVCLEYVIGGLLLCLTIVGIPFGLQCMKLGQLALLPFGHHAERDPAAVTSGCLGLGLNVLWVVVAGVWIFLSHLALALTLALTVIGIPFAIQHVKLAALALAPFGRKVVVSP